MANVYWTGAATPEGQEDTVTITAFDVATTYRVTINNVTIETIGVTDADGTAEALQDLLSASTHPYFSSIIWTVATNVVTGNSRTTGMPFIISTSVAGGTGSIANATLTTAVSPNHWDVAANWSTGSVPVSTDNVIISNSDINIRWGLDQNAVALTSLRIDKSFSGSIGLQVANVAQSVNGDQVSPVGPEYRDLYLIIGATSLIIGENTTSVREQGSPMVKIDVRGISEIQVLDSSNFSEETSKPAVQLLTNNASTNLCIKRALASVGVAVGTPFETSTIGNIIIASGLSAGGFISGQGVTMSTYEQFSGNNFIESAATIPSMLIKGGVVTTSGSFAITTIVVSGSGLVNSNSTGTVTTMTINVGEVVTLGNSLARTITNLQINIGGTFSADPSIVTVTNFLKPDGAFTMTAEG